ncbi:SCAR-like protein 1 isoform X2 [Phoenix dactylifera]|uniref:Protein SCAR n=1 Tax=Phoenix dactylifera TaxID=42345 RepID=A0A8B8J8D4_PHODC|nr:SCAR-like protein 1 isoform X2 [Phoenix dactylifera]
MPMIRYQIRNEYGLADPELYGTAQRDDPEALLEGVAMAGLVGVLRQLGDLAAFAAEIFHDLHEEVMATAARGHGLMLRVQQLEAEFPSIEKTFFTQTNNSSFPCNDGIDWHANIQMDQNLITQGDMPRFILDSYEECRGPPHLFTLDKFDVAGAGACLKRYSDPSFFKVVLASSGMLETELPREKKARKTKKKGSRRKNGQTLESLLAPDADFDLRQITFDQVSEKTSRHVRLKTRHSNGMDKSNDRGLMERLLEIHLSEQKVLFGNSISHSHVKINPIDSNESATEIREIAVDASADRPLVRVTDLIQSPDEKEVAGLPLYDLEMQKIKNKELSEVLHDSFGELKKTDSDYLVVEQKEMSTECGYKSEVCLDGYVFNQPETTPSLQVVDQNKLLGDAECKTEGGASDDISSELDNFVDALNTMESELETDFECRGKAEAGVFNMESHGEDSDTNEAQQELQAQFSERDSVDNSAKSLSSNTMLKNEVTSISDSDASSLAVAQPTQRNMVSLDLPANSEIWTGKTHNNTTETDCKDMEKSDLGVVIVEPHGKNSDNNEAQQELQVHFSEPDSVDNSTKSLDLNNMFKNETTCVSESDTTINPLVGQPTQRNMVSVDFPANSEICPAKSHDKTTEELWQDDEDMELNSSGSSLESDHLETPHPAEHVEELISEDMAGTFDMPDLFSQIEDRSVSREVPTGYIEDSLLSLTASIIGESQESTEPDTRACSGGAISPTISAFSPDINSIASKPDSLATELENGMQPEDIVSQTSSGFVKDTHDIAEEFDGSSPGTKDDVSEKIHPSDHSVELNSEDVTIMLDMTNHHSQTRDECFLEKVPPGFVEDSTLSSTGHIGETQESMKQDTEACLCGSISPTIPALSPDISFTVQPEGLAAEMENVVAPSENLACSTVGPENAEEMAEYNILVPNTLAPELEYFADAKQPQEFPYVVSTGFTHLCSLEETCPSDMQLPCNVPNHELIECPIPVDDTLKLLDEPTVHTSQENTLQTGEPTQCDDLVAENAIFEHNSDNAHSSSTYSPETSGLQVQSQEYGIPDVAAVYQHQVEKQEAISPKDKTALDSQNIRYRTLPLSEEDQPDKSALDSQSIQYRTLPLSEEDQPVAASTAFDPELSILYSSDPSDFRLLTDVCRTKSSGDVQTDLHSDNDEANSVCSLESKQDFVLKALPCGGCESTEEKKLPPSTHFLSEPTILLEEAASKLEIGRELNVLPVHQEGGHLDLHAPTIDLNDEPSEEGPELRSHDSATNADVSELDTPLSNKAICWQVEPEASTSSACSSELISSSLASNVSAVMLPFVSSSDAMILETSPQLPVEPQYGKPVSSFPFQDVEEPPPLLPLPPLEWRRGKLQLGSLSSVGSLFQPPSGTNRSMAPSATDWKHGHGLLAGEGEMVKPANPFVTLPVLEAKSSQHGLLKSEGEKMHPFRLSELPPIADDEYQHDAPFLEGKVAYSSNPSLVVSPVEDEKHRYSHNSVGGVMLLPSNPFASLSALEDEISQCSPLLQGETPQPSEVTGSQHDQLLSSELERDQDSRHDRLSLESETIQPPKTFLAGSHHDQLLSSELERDQDSGHGRLILESETIQPPKTFLVQSDIEHEQHQHGSEICGVENLHLLQSSMPVPATGTELPKPGHVTSREDGQSSQIDALPTPDDENSNVKPRSIRNRPRDPLIEAVAAHDRSTMRKISEMVRPSNKPKEDERDSLLEQIRSKSFNLKPAAVTKPNIKGPPTNLKVAAIIEKANAIRQAFVGSDEDNEDSWSDS